MNGGGAVDVEVDVGGREHLRPGQRRGAPSLSIPRIFAWAHVGAHELDVERARPA